MWEMLGHLFFYLESHTSKIMSQQLGVFFWQGYYSIDLLDVPLTTESTVEIRWTVSGLEPVTNTTIQYRSVQYSTIQVTNTTIQYRKYRNIASADQPRSWTSVNINHPIIIEVEIVSVIKEFQHLNLSYFQGYAGKVDLQHILTNLSPSTEYQVNG